ncbi:MAG: aromatic ring-hydroxylating dioxygenase subunit alpha [Planktotalea sp.]|jgi:choline monooxygenase|uniref:aromatic ring-hydroxylating oxygenase subunit alpha n=1 Tax=Planktotalea sp. TaxID=2029877 RepID=UPI000183989F|nr:aromatic ring-hydroxylating dioxygenase subunit alpha [Planktotalea sp.]EDZ41398.1 rieske (2Fe-2S) protein [Rhodobacteraceae bacterium HTCC2083]MDG1075658.1 aromatic ring-hydroxylating dioxygenase subunit alpha [Planktotalea sp.]MDG1086017.1 aromatic ring-hydroxylating dioxygenase subunit alpha [Planktotalea sp.]HCW85782.1 aromatic ring-hydroxylating dioxygenase subunit alpha [Paracoccaceae bacterium]
MTAPLTDLSHVRRPVSEAQGLPNPHYIDSQVYNEEKHAVLFSSWSGLAVAADVPEIGDAVPLTFVGMPLLVIRDKSNTVRVFQNTCRHRGMILVEEPRKIEGAIRCPYHSWCYSTEGRLVSTPHVGGPGQNTHESIDRDLLGLIEVPSHIWRDVIWINIDGTALPFEDANADLIARWAEFDKPLYHGGADSAFQLEVECNWKLAVENYCESYHLPWVHPGLNSYSRLEDHYHIEKQDSYSGQGTLVYRQLKAADGQVFADFEDVGEKWNEAAEYITVYPNVLLGVHRDHAFAIVLVPKSTERTVENIHLYYATPKTNDAMRAANTEQWKLVFEEDIFVVEGMQKGRHSPNFDGGRFSAVMDSPTHCFHAWIAGKIENYRATAQAAE